MNKQHFPQYWTKSQSFSNLIPLNHQLRKSHQEVGTFFLKTLFSWKHSRFSKLCGHQSSLGKRKMSVVAICFYIVGGKKRMREIDKQKENLERNQVPVIDVDKPKPCKVGQQWRWPADRVPFLLENSDTHPHYMEQLCYLMYQLLQNMLDWNTSEKSLGKKIISSGLCFASS